MDLGEKIRMYRMNAGLTQTKLGEMIDINPRTISKWESGVLVPGLPEIRKVCKALNIKKSDLIEEEEKPKESAKVKGGLSKKKQAYLKGLSEATTVIAKVLRVFIYIGIVCLVLCVILVPFLFNTFDINGHTVTMKKTEEKVELINDGTDVYKIKVGDKVTDLDIGLSTSKIDYVLDNYSKAQMFCYLEITFIIAISSLILVTVLLKYIQKLAINIGEGDVFAEENPMLLKNIGYVMIAIIVVPFLAGIVPNAIMGTDFGEDFTFVNVLEVLIVFALSYIFEYGYKLSQKVSLPIYDENNKKA